MVNYLGKFIPNFQLMHLISKSYWKKVWVMVLWCFGNKHENEIDNLKQLITNCLVLKFYNPELPIKVSCDASLKGLGAVLEQKHDIWHPVSYASRSLTSAEENYCQLEKEILSIVFACSKFHEFIYGKQFDIYNNHLPLKSIFNKTVLKVPPTVQRFLLQLRCYDFTMNYIKGSPLTITDTLSRAPLKHKKSEIDNAETSSYIHLIESNYLISDFRLQQFKDETKLDETLQTLLIHIQN